jgi:hypothetical protein
MEHIISITYYLSNYDKKVMYEYRTHKLNDGEYISCSVMKDRY